MAFKEKYFLQQFIQEEYLHGGVGGSDAEKVLLGMGFKPLAFPHHHKFGLGAKIARFYFLARTLLRIRNGSLIVFLFPVYATMARLLLNALSGKKGIRCICFIMDINGLKDGDEQVLREEITMLKKFRYFIVHNEEMRTWLLKHVSGQALSSTVEFFDFLASPANISRAVSREIVFAGNLAKSGFLKNLPLLATSQPQLRFNLYGPGMFALDESFSQIRYFGVFPPHELPSRLEGSFGLVWDGDSVERPSASLGHYMQFITHHKLSLYILAKLPIIIASSAGAAILVKKYSIGLTIDSLFDLEQTISRVSLEEYRQMQENMTMLAERISRGKFLQEALEQLNADAGVTPRA